MDQQERRNLEQALQEAIEQNQFELYYQPQIDIKSGKLVGLEALLRWKRPEYRDVSPLAYISVAEQTGAIIPIGSWVLNEACRTCLMWHSLFGVPFRIAVNVSAVQLQEDGFVDVVKQALDRSGLPPSYLDLELTESVAMLQEDTLIQKLHELKSIGVRLSLDDFGSGYSSLNYLINYPIDTLKIDRTFTQSLSSNSKTEVVLTCMLDLAHRLELEVIAEGVETEMQYAFYEQHNCDVVQGYYFSPPLPKPKTAMLLETLLEA
ncbi:putative bifunctional diguanylate cyclase/phosphodiesterase [Paenibacillus sp. y28]|uniref:putative bifunctional diguanylate cyclase/phosphodiesterase n=1 Tax=Paenibacillus sp. y28 TaxID=3129110 RepID=UPI003016D4F3